MDNLLKFYIDGAWVAPPSEQVFPVMNPATEEQVGEIILGNTDGVNRAVAAAKKAFVTLGHIGMILTFSSSCCLRENMLPDLYIDGVLLPCPS